MDKPVLTLDELRSALGESEKPAKRRQGESLDRIHERAVEVLHALRGLSKSDKRRVLSKAGKLLDA